MLNVGKSEESYSVSVIVNDSNNDRWIALRQGLEQAAGDYNINLNYVSTEGDSERGRTDGASEPGIGQWSRGIIIQTIDSEEAASS